MQRNAFLPFWVCPSSMSSSIVLISLCSSQQCRNILFGLLFLRDSPHSTWFLPVSHFCTWSRCRCRRLGLPVSCGSSQSVRWCEGSLSLCGAAHCELLQQVLKSSLVPSGGGWGGVGGWVGGGGVGGSRGWSLCSTEKRMCDQRGHMHTFSSCATNRLKHCLNHQDKDQQSSFRVCVQMCAWWSLPISPLTPLTLRVV